ncbi:MAG: hypothetical protein J7K65_00710, partial [Planctomycetes bacterium]|nr:hypothetical protein [Planctomycetota bacterium]
HLQKEYRINFVESTEYANLPTLSHGQAQLDRATPSLKFNLQLSAQIIPATRRQFFAHGLLVKKGPAAIATEC